MGIMQKFGGINGDHKTLWS